jgi:hypothetical protein
MTAIVVGIIIPSFGESGGTTRETTTVNSIQIELSNKQWTITIRDLERLKRELISFLVERENKFYETFLVDDLRRVTPMISQNNEVRIGGWDLIVRNHKLLLQTKPILHENFRVSYTATLAVIDGNWHIIDVTETVNKRLGL